MKCFCCLVALAFFMASCNQGRIEELESKNDELEQKVSSLKSKISELESENEDLESLVSNMRQDMRTIRNCASSASSSAHSAAFWADSGDSFLFQSNLRNMSSDFNQIVSIASKY